MKIQSPKQRKTRIDFLENSSRNKKWILCDDVKAKSNQDAIHNLDEITTKSCRLGIEETLRSKIKIETLRLKISISIMNRRIKIKISTH